LKRIPAWAIVVAILTCGGAAACGTAARRPPDVGGARFIVESLPLRVQNHSPADMNVFVVEDGAWKRIGFVGALGSATFELGVLERNGAPLRILAVPVSGRGAARSEPLTVLPGQTATFTIEADLARSSAVVR
jgi:hypothetical protein